VNKLKPKVLVVGASGLLGGALVRNLEGEFEVYGTYLRNKPSGISKIYRLDASNDEELENLFRNHSFDFVINCSGLTSVDECEKRPEATWILNGYVPAKLASLLKFSSGFFMNISTDHFYSVDLHPRTETAEVRALNQYGYSKLFAEEAVLSINPSSASIRTNFFGLGKKNGASLLDFAKCTIEKNESLVGFTDIEFSPIGTSYLSSALSKFLQNPQPGIWNISSTEVISKYEFLKLVAKALNKDSSRILKGRIVDQTSLALRPSYLALNPSKFNKYFDTIAPSIEEMISAELRSGSCEF
jgi:dTDP-4-dehydrorhamnose reductase